MTLFFAVGGVDLGATTVRLEGGIAGLTAWADGNTATAGVEVDDPSGSLNFIDLQTFTVNETDCTSAPRCYTGYIYNLRIKRGPYRTSAGRVWVFDVADLNFLLRLRTLRGADAKRPRETIDARRAWLMGTAGMSGVVFDNGLVATRGVSMVDEADYRHQYHSDVWQDIATGWIFYVYWNGSQPSMFFNSPTATTNTSTLTISNVLSDVNNTTCFAPNENSELLGAGEAIYDGVDYTYLGNANIYRQLASTFSTFGLHRDGTVNSSRVGKLATAESEAATYLSLHSGQIDTITCVVQLPSSKVNLIDAGMRVSVRFSHLPGYTSFTYTRVTSRTVTLSAGTDKLYDVQLELSVKGIGQPNAGGGGTVPPQNPCVPGTGVLVQSVNATAAVISISLPAAPTVGNTMICAVALRIAGADVVPPIGMTALSTGYVHDADNETSGALFYRVVADGDTGTITFPGLSGNDICYLEERTGQLAPDSPTLFMSADPYGGGNPYSAAPITPTTGKLGVVMGLFVYKGNLAAPTAVTGYTLVETNIAASVCRLAVVALVPSSTSGSYTPGLNDVGIFDGHGYGSITVAFLCTSTNADNPPVVGQPIVGEFIANGDGTTTLFQTAFPYAPGSLKVYVDGHQIINGLTETNPTIGAFTIDFAPLGATGDTRAEIVSATYQGAAGASSGVIGFGALTLEAS